MKGNRVGAQDMPVWFVNFREKGPDAALGGYVRCDSIAERDEVSAYLKSLDFRVEWEEYPPPTITCQR